MATNALVGGLIPTRQLGGGEIQTNQYTVLSGDSSAIYIGSPVMLAGTADADGTPNVVVASVGCAERMIGIVVGVKAATAESLVYRAASTARTLLVADAPDLVFAAQSDEDSYSIDAEDMGENLDLTADAGSTVTGRSSVKLDASDHKTATAQVRMLRMLRRVGLDGEADSYPVVECIWNEHAHKSTTGY